jgi:nitroreductase
MTTTTGMATGTPTLTVPNPTDHPVHDLIERRWSPRDFTTTPVEDEKLQQVFEAARWAASSSNTQPWRFLLTRQGEASFSTLRSCLSEGNQPWTEHVPVLVLCTTQTTFPAKDDKPERENTTAKLDLGLALGNLILQATALGLHVHPMAGFGRRKAREVFSIPDAFEPVVVLAIGTSAAEPDPDKRSRKPLSEIVFGGEWGEPAELG